MVVECTCGNWHALTPTAMTVVLLAFQQGDMQTVSGDGVKPECMEKAFTTENVVAIEKRYPGRSVQFTKGGVG